jgi:hypothetical protein
MDEQVIAVPPAKIPMPDGVTTFKEYVEQQGVVSWATAYSRFYNKGWSLEEAATAPKGSRLTLTPRRKEQIFAAQTA